MIKKYRIATFTFAMEYPDCMILPDTYEIFECEAEAVDYSYTIRLVEDFEIPKLPFSTVRENLLVYTEQGLETRFIGWTGSGFFYAKYQELDETHAEIFMKEAYLEYSSINVILTSMLSLERRVLQQDSLILHCAYMERNGKAILFSAPSETGKTTQANLWKEYRGCDTVNGDRSLLQMMDGQWYAGGWPVCGTSGVCFNKTLPIEAIVMLSQAPENSIENLRPMHAFSQIYSQITINRWNEAAHNKAMNLIEQLIGQVPVYHLACNISEDAVRCLETKLV